MSITRSFGLALSSALVALLAGSAFGQNGECGDVLVWSTGNPDGQVGAIAQWLFDSGHFTSVTGINQDAPFSLNELDKYDRVLYFSNHSQNQDPDALGDRLNEFAGTGKRLVLATFAWAEQGGNTLAGDIIELGTSPLVPDGVTLYSDVDMASNDGGSLFLGVNAVHGFYHDDVSLSNGAVENATWSDGQPMVASKGNLVAVNLFPDDSFGQIGGDYRQLFVNALCDRVPSPGAAGLLGMAGLMAARRRR